MPQVTVRQTRIVELGSDTRFVPMSEPRPLRDVLREAGIDPDSLKGREVRIGGARASLDNDIEPGTSVLIVQHIAGA